MLSRCQWCEFDTTCDKILYNGWRLCKPKQGQNCYKEYRAFLRFIEHPKNFKNPKAKALAKQRFVGGSRVIDKIMSN